jgi:D-glycero-alpha-D-manno-heptose-7-phosphate kinase
MLIARSPLRISLGGGGTDLPSYYKDHEGFLVAAAIDKYVYTAVSTPFVPGIFLKYNEYEHVENLDSVKHPIIREALKLIGLEKSQIEISTFADIPAGTGLGSSGSFTTSFLKALMIHSNKVIHAEELAQLACHIEIERLKEPIGKQDQYIAAYGGLNCFTFHKDGKVIVSPLNITKETIHKLEDNLLLFFTGYSRSASGILKDQHVKSQNNDKEMIDNLNYVKELGYRIKEALENGDVENFGLLMHEHWENKKKRSGGMSNSSIDDWYDLAMKNGAIGGKLVGAGGGGFLMFLASDSNQLRLAMHGAGLEEVRFKFDFNGTKVMLG